MLCFTIFSIERQIMMNKSHLQRAVYSLLTAVALASCTAPAPQAVQQQQLPPSVGGQPDLGVVVSIRPVTFSAGESADLSGVNAVLSALGQQAVLPPVAGEEIVIQKDDGNAAAIAEETQLTGLSIGDRILVVQGSAPTILRRN